MTRLILVCPFLLFGVLLPNLVWLGFSTARIANGETVSIHSVIVHVDEEKTELGDLAPGERRFIVLPKSGDATFTVTYKKGAESEAVCSEYVEGDMYHVEVRLKGTAASQCSVSLPLLSELFILKWL